MSATYNISLPTDRDWVRRAISDTNTASPIFQDEEIDAILDDEATTCNVAVALKFFGAARCIDIMVMKNATGGVAKGLMGKRVGDLQRSFGVSASTAATLEEEARKLRMRGARLMKFGRGSGFMPIRAMRSLFLALAASALLSGAVSAQSFFWLQFLPPVATASALPTCAVDGIENNRSRVVQDVYVTYHCIGGSWHATQSTAADHAASHAQGGDDPLTGTLTVSITGSSASATTAATATLATTATTANSGDSATEFFSTGIIGPGILGTGTPTASTALFGDNVWRAISADPTLAGDVDGLGSANDLDEAAVRDELEGVLRLPQLQGTLPTSKQEALTDADIPNNITINLATAATTAATASDLACSDCTGATEIDGASLESEIEAVADLQDFQGAITAAQLPASLTTSLGIITFGTELSLRLIGGNLAIMNADGTARLQIRAAGYEVIDGSTRRFNVYGGAPFNSVGLSADMSLCWAADASDSGGGTTCVTKGAANLIKFANAIQLTPTDTAPSCSSSDHKDKLWSRLSVDALCRCNGSAWVKIVGADSCP